VIIVNLFPVRFFGELEYVFGSIKLAFICLLIVLMLILDNMKRMYCTFDALAKGNADTLTAGPHAYYDEAPGTKCTMRQSHAT
jgi:amino acid permease